MTAQHEGRPLGMNRCYSDEEVDLYLMLFRGQGFPETKELHFPHP